MFPFTNNMMSFAFLSALQASGRSKLFGDADYSRDFSVHIPCSDLMFGFLVGGSSSIPFGLDEDLPFGPNPVIADSP